MSASRSLVLLMLLLLGSCGDEPSQPSQPSTTKPPTTGPGMYTYNFRAEHLRPLGANGVYVAWIRYIGDSTYSQHTGMFSFFRPPPDSMTFSGDLALRHALDSVAEILVSVEPDTTSPLPTSPLAKGSAVHGVAFLGADSIFGELQNAHATVTFATHSADTAQAQNEFYLMTVTGGIPSPGTVDLPVAAAGWQYSFWVTDSGYEPKHLFYYGSFTNPTGPDTDTLSGEYPFPGGYRRNTLTDPGAKIILALQPAWQQHATAPLPFNILQLQLKRFIHNGESMTMTNVATTGIPHGYFSLTKK